METETKLSACTQALLAAGGSKSNTPDMLPGKAGTVLCTGRPAGSYLLKHSSEKLSKVWKRKVGQE